MSTTAELTRPEQIALKDSVEKMTRDLKAAAKGMTAQEVRYCVDFYYAIQENRKRAANQVRAAGGEPVILLDWLFRQSKLLETRIKAFMDDWSEGYEVGRWSKAQMGIGPVLSAGLLAHIDIRKAPTAGQIWRFAGLDPSVTWEKGQKRPWNARLKTLCWKVGESFVKVSGKGEEEAFYGYLWKKRKEQEEARNERGEFAAAAKAKLERFRIGKGTEAYKKYSEGKLPPAHIHARSKRWVVKVFLAHWYEVAYLDVWGKMPPTPYVIEHLGHTKWIERPRSQD